MSKNAIQFTTHHSMPSDSLKNHALKRLETIERHFNQITNIKVTFNVEGTNRYKASVAVMVPPRKLLFADEVASDMYEAVDLVMRKVDHLVRDHKSKIREHPHDDKS